MKLNTLKPRLKELDTANPRGMKMADQRPPLTLATIRTKRFTTAKNGRLLPLSSDAWRRLRAMVLSEQPLCPECEARGIIEPATQVHHINDNAMDNSRTNLVGLCASCHSRHTAHDMGKQTRYGCDLTGQPADPSHHWNKPSLSRPGDPVTPSRASDDEKSTEADRAKPTCFHHANANRGYEP